MRRVIGLLTITALALSVASSAHGRAVTDNAESPAMEFAPHIVLRSAFHLRSSERDRLAPDASAKESRHRIQRHFRLVIGYLRANGSRNLDVALERLRSARGEHWSPAELEAWRQKLALRRELNIQRLRRYQIHGQFPQNEHVANRAVPIFVDNHDTACAVGHLMRESGWGLAVAAIQAANNFVYVTDVESGPLIDWVLVSGLIQEEAALIQPGYYHIFPVTAPRLDVLSTGGEVSQNRIVFINFQFIAGDLSDPLNFPAVPPATSQYPLANYAVRTGEGVFYSGGRSFDTVFDNWIVLGGRDEEAGVYPTNGHAGVIFSFDASVVNPQARFVGASIDSLLGNLNRIASDGKLDIRSVIYAASTGTPIELATLSIDGGPANPGNPNVVKQDSALFLPQSKIKIVTSARLEGLAVFTSLFQSFQVVPEPAVGGIGTFGWMSMIALLGRRKKKQ